MGRKEKWYIFASSCPGRRVSLLSNKVTGAVQGFSLDLRKPTFMEPSMALVFNLVRTGGFVMADLRDSCELAGESILPVCGCVRLGGGNFEG